MEPTAGQKSSKLEWFFFIIVLPLLFITLLAFILLWFLDYDVKEKVFTSLNQIPVVEKIIPDQLTDKENLNKETLDPQTMILNLQRSINDKDQTLLQIDTELNSKEETIKVLQNQIEELKQQTEKEQLTEAERIQQIDDLAKIYENMNAKDAAKILSNLSNEETVLIMGQMSVESKSSILGKMDPKKSASLSILLKDQKYTKDKDIASLQKRIEQLVQEIDQLKKNDLSFSELAETFSKMNPFNAANTLISIYDQDPSLTFRILAKIETDKRSELLNQIDIINSNKAADITIGIASIDEGPKK